jgi:hypothetical protein
MTLDNESPEWCLFKLIRVKSADALVYGEDKSPAFTSGDDQATRLDTEFRRVALVS